MYFLMSFVFASLDLNLQKIANIQKNADSAWNNAARCGARDNQNPGVLGIYGIVSDEQDGWWKTFFAHKNRLNEAKKELEDRSADDLYIVGQRFYSGQIVAQSYDDARRYFLLSAQKGLAKSQLLIGTMYSKGEGGETNHEEAMKWFKKAQDQGNTEAKEKYLSAKRMAEQENKRKQAEQEKKDREERERKRQEEAEAQAKAAEWRASVEREAKRKIEEAVRSSEILRKAQIESMRGDECYKKEDFVSAVRHFTEARNLYDQLNKVNGRASFMLGNSWDELTPPFLCCNFGAYTYGEFKEWLLLSLWPIFGPLGIVGSILYCLPGTLCNYKECVAIAEESWKKMVLYPCNVLREKEHADFCCENYEDLEREAWVRKRYNLREAWTEALQYNHQPAKEKCMFFCCVDRDC